MLEMEGVPSLTQVFLSFYALVKKTLRSGGSNDELIYQWL
jgi:hypothetical protein